MNVRTLAVAVALLTSSLLVSRDARGADENAQVRTSIRNYMKAWNTADGKKRQALLRAAWADNATYTDPTTAQLKGRAALVEHIGGFLSSPQTKGASILPGSGIEIHHDVFRFEWIMKDANGNTVTRGMDFGEFNEQGAITKIVGFFGPFPAADADAQE